jgi:ribosomal protein S18 acetylase RimI-like enzyme
MSNQLLIRNALPTDLDAIISLDRATPEADKPDYWRGIFEHYVVKGRADRIFLVAEKGGTVIGFIVGEVRAWEFGSPPCGWVFALAVSPDAREHGTGKQMWDEICRRLKKTGVTTVRTMANLDQKLTLSFLRSMGLRTGRYIELEKQLD